MVLGKHQGGVRWHFRRRGTPPLSIDLRCPGDSPSSFPISLVGPLPLMGKGMVVRWR
ncbi:hypothetical protein HanHA300_Chr03g0085401 [Helianthus annuus]|nr:hypothetical protein HanHA300_Chr03g0085401 [Helianthus annuus]KAJ0600030.1 hypothetical protein HanIR_Chr03g0111921 [Helianthus annuus]KAJ0607456.1 hypothetical protein HanHA89_Chr03g0096961 [Helianthus annuus]KAJ0767512.1 hypothetical protein HanLR1_Chr03g0090241 [Helianthus annuus]KAJ0943016.1 hypothetical protein HanPSC8_Chr03g0098991 [Helianthus annuus]